MSTSSSADANGKGITLANGTRLPPPVRARIQMTRTELVELIERPAETLAVEVKQWLRPDDPIEGAKIARALMALRDFDGGVLIIGLDDTTYVAAGGDRPAELRETYHPDKIQALVGKFARSPFEVNVHFIPKGGTDIPVVVVPGGITSPVMCRSTIREPNGQTVLEQNAIYTRCLANDSVSSCKPVTPADWESLLARCFANREADVARFIERHIPNIIDYLSRANSTTDMANSAHATNERTSSTPRDQRGEDPRVHLKIPVELLDYGRTRFEARVAELQSSGKLGELPDHGSWETACEIEGYTLKYTASDKFLNELFLYQPGYTGWPMWRDTRAAQNELFRPVHFQPRLGVAGSASEATTFREPHRFLENRTERSLLRGPGRWRTTSQVRVGINEFQRCERSTSSW